jgi:hypothetical protein
MICEKNQKKVVSIEKTFTRVFSIAPTLVFGVIRIEFLRGNMDFYLKKIYVTKTSFKVSI